MPDGKYVEVLQPDMDDDSPIAAWVRYDDAPTPDVALAAAKLEIDPRWNVYIEPEPVLLRTETDVEAAINGHEFPYYVPCTSRARSPEKFWRVVIQDVG